MAESCWNNRQKREICLGGMGMIYREFEPKDLPAIRDLLENDLGYRCEVDGLQKRIDEMMMRGNYKIFVACDGYDVVGFIGCVTYLAFELDNEGMKIIALAVSTEYRGKGVGSGLIKTAEDWAKENDVGVILVNSGLQREKTHIFYENKGYRKKSYGFIKNI